MKKIGNYNYNYLEAIVRKRGVSIAQLADDPRLSADGIVGLAESRIVAA